MKRRQNHNVAAKLQENIFITLRVIQMFLDNRTSMMYYLIQVKTDQKVTCLLRQHHLVI